MTPDDERDTVIKDLRAQLRVATKPPCLLCQGAGTVEINDPRQRKPETRRCPRGCRLKRSAPC